MASNEITGFTPGKTYSFTSQEKIDCMRKEGSVHWIKAICSKGLCIQFDRQKNKGRFLGIPKGETEEFYFHLQFKSGECAIIEGEK